jgi:CBS domain-containing protein
MKLARLMVSDYMTPNPITVEPEELNTKYGALPVVADGRVIEILTDNDLTRALVDVMREAKAAAG